MTSERAKELQALMRAGDIPTADKHPRGITTEEDKEVKALWLTMPWNTCWMNALSRIAHGKGGTP